MEDATERRLREWGLLHLKDKPKELQQELLRRMGADDPEMAKRVEAEAKAKGILL